MKALPLLREALEAFALEMDASNPKHVDLLHAFRNMLMNEQAKDWLKKAGKLV